MIKYIVAEDNEQCILCNRPRECWHHCFGGHGRRSISEREGLVVPLCNACHNMTNKSVHFNKQIDLLVKKLAQKKFEEHHTRERFIKLFGRNYLDD